MAEPDPTEKPHVFVPPGETPPAELVIEDVVEGDGAEAVPGHDVEVHYVGVAWSTRQQFDASWDRGDTFQFGLGAGQVIKGWDQGVAGMKVGGPPPHRHPAAPRLRQGRGGRRDPRRRDPGVRGRPARRALTIGPIPAPRSDLTQTCAFPQAHQTVAEAV